MKLMIKACRLTLEVHHGIGQACCFSSSGSRVQLIELVIEAMCFRHVF